MSWWAVLGVGYGLLCVVVGVVYVAAMLSGRGATRSAWPRR